jgi:hypothetical protein
MTQSPAAFGLYPSTKALHLGAEALRAAKFRHTDISVMYSDGEHALRLREHQPAERDVLDDDGASLGGILTSLSGIGAIDMPEDGPYMAGGPILSTLSGTPDNLPSSLRGLGIPESDIQSFEERLREGGLLLSVQCDDCDWAARAQEILAKTGAERVAASDAALGAH